jgi:O-antigen/teichoic acid export membrane protein
VLLGFGTTGALAGQALGMLLAWGYTEARLRGHLMGVVARPLSLSRSRLVAVTLGAVGSTLATTALLSVDALLAKHYLGPGEAGVYSAVSLAGKVLMFAVGFVPMILLPKATHAAMRGEPVLPFLIGGSAMSLALTAVALGAYALIPGTVVHVMVGSAYDAAAPLLLPYGFAMALLATTNIVVAYKIAVHRFEFVVPLLLCAGAEAVGIVLHHGTIAEIVTVLIGAQALGLVISLLPWNVRRTAPYPTPPAEATGGVA